MGGFKTGSDFCFVLKMFEILKCFAVVLCTGVICLLYALCYGDIDYSKCDIAMYSINLFLSCTSESTSEYLHNLCLLP